MKLIANSLLDMSLLLFLMRHDFLLTIKHVLILFHLAINFKIVLKEILKILLWYWYLLGIRKD